MTEYFQTIDKDGFHSGTIHFSVVTDSNKHLTVKDPPPEDPLHGFEKWRWVEEKWQKVENYEHHYWYNPEDPDQEYRATSWNAQPPPDWVYWAPGTNKELSETGKNVEKWKEVRKIRDELLKKSDWTQLPDVNILNKTEWKIYREELRNITNQPDPFKLTWPKQPVI